MYIEIPNQYEKSVPNAFANLIEHTQSDDSDARVVRQAHKTDDFTKPSLD